MAPPGAAQSSRPPLDAQNPWPGLDSFREADQQFFRGRAQEATELFRLVERSRLAALYGVSGIGKSSLLQAGLFPLLRERGMLPIRIRLDFTSKESDLIAQVKEAISVQTAAAGVEAPVPNELETLWEYFHRREQSFWDERNRLVTPVLAIDQFEELFTHGVEGAQLAPRTREFLVELADLAEGRPPDVLDEWLKEHPEDASRFLFNRHHYRILIGLREDFLAQLDDLRDIMPSIAANRKHLLPMDGRSALEVVSQAPHLISAEVATQVVRFVGKADSAERDLAEVVVDPALLSVMCSELNEKRRRRGETTISGDLLEGSREEILRDFYERAMKDVSAATRMFVEERLILDPGYRDTVALDVVFRTPGVGRDDIDRLVRRRLVRIEQRGAIRRLELTHDLLVGVILESRNKRQIEEKAEHEKAARVEAEQREWAARRILRRTRMVAAALVLLSVIAVGGAIVALRAMKMAQQAQARAHLNKQIAEDAVDDLAGLAGSQSVEVATEAPETLQFREQLLSKAQEIYGKFNRRDQSSEDLRRDTAMGHFRRGDLFRLRGEADHAIEQYQTAIKQFADLVRGYRTNTEYRKSLGDVYNWLGETERPFSTQRADAEKAYDNALDLQSQLQREFPKNSYYRQAAARTYDNRGILRADGGRYDDADADYRQAIALLAPVAETDQYRQELARAKNNLALLIVKANRSGDARSLYDQAIQIGEVLTKHNPANREYKLELAEYNNNSAILLQDDNPALAKQRNARAIDLIKQLGQPAPYLRMQLALAHSIRGWILQTADPGTAEAEYQLAINAFNDVPREGQDRYFHLWFGQALMNMAEVSSTPKEAAVRFLVRAIEEQKAAGSHIDVAWDYYYLAEAYRNLRSFESMRHALESARSILPELAEPDRQQLTQLLNGMNASQK